MAVSAAWQGWGVVCDFDGTITMRDTAWTMLHIFGPPGWKRFEAAFHAGTMSDQQVVTEQFRLVGTPITELREWALANTSIRPGAHEFFAWCSQNDLPVTVASNGLDFYIDAVLQEHDLPTIDVVCGRAEQRAGWIAVSYEHLKDPTYPLVQDHKLVAVQRLKARGLKVAYIGDGAPDYAAAAASDLIFARYRLKERCDANGIPYQPFEDFLQIVVAIERGDVLDSVRDRPPSP